VVKQPGLTLEIPAQELSVPMSRVRVLAGLGAGVIVLSFAAVIIKATPAPSVVIAAGRLVVAGFVLTPFFWVRLKDRAREWRGVPVWPAVGAGLLLAAHFYLWVESLNRTSVASSVVLVAMNPIFVAALSPLFLRERVSWRMAVAVLLGAAGAVVIAGPELKSASVTGGNLLALGGAVCAGAYLMLGRRLRPRLSLVSYVYVVYGTAALILTGAVLVTGVSLARLSWQAVGLIVLLGLGPQLLGHTSFNWALKHVPAPLVAMAVLGEPVGATILAWLLLGQVPAVHEAAGGVVTCAGIYLAAAEARRAV
jgi:drug/metabolite transporter (DMT)-like permease